MMELFFFSVCLSTPLQDEEAVVSEGKCCPECVGRSCVVDGAVYQVCEQVPSDSSS